MAIIDRYRVNDSISAIAAEFGVTLPDDVLNDLTHQVADVLELHSKRMHCRDCGSEMFLDDNEVAFHGTGPEDVDYDADAAHVAHAEEVR